MDTNTIDTMGWNTIDTMGWVTIDCPRHGLQYNTLCIPCFNIEINRKRKEYIDNKKWWQFWKWGYDGGINRVDGYPDS